MVTECWVLSSDCYVDKGRGMFWRGSDVTELLDNKYDNYVLDHSLTLSYHTQTLSHATNWAGETSQ